jgi:hypothetical protein
MPSPTPFNELSYLDYGVAGLLCIAVIVLFKLYLSERNKNDGLRTQHQKELTDQGTSHKEEMKAILYELVADAREHSNEYLQVADRITNVLESLERRVTKTDRRR